MSNNKLKWLGFIGLILLGMGVNLLIFKDSIIKHVSSSILIIEPTSIIYDIWRKTPIDIPTNFYFFNWTNKEDFYNLSVKPKFDEMGPYGFKQNIERVNVTWNDNNTVTFKQVHYFEYGDGKDSGNFSDEITTLNYIYMATAHHTRYWDTSIKRVGSFFTELLGSNYYMTETVAAQTLGGVDNNILNLAHYLPYVASEIPRVPGFGWLKIMNGDADFNGVFNVANGFNRNFDLLSWNYETKTPYFNDSCNEVRGSLGDFHSYRKDKQRLRIFIPYICRYLTLNFEKEEHVDGILGYKYTAQDEILDNGTKLPDNKCFCGGECIPSGMLNVSSCRYGINGYTSLPHFYQADPIYLEGVHGLKPDRSKHESYIIIEPTTMLPLKFRARMQMNFYVHPVENIPVFEKAPRVYFPVYWAEQKLNLPSHISRYIKMFLSLPFIISSFSAILMASGLFLISFASYYVILKRGKTVPVKFKPELTPLKADNFILVGNK